MPAFVIDGTPINYISNHENPPANGKRILFIHGTGCNARVFERHMGVLEEHHAVAIDLPGHGGSGGDGFRGVVDYLHYAVELVREFGWDKCIVAGHSLGGGIAIAFATYHQQLLEGLILIDTGARLRVAPAIIENARRVAEGLRGGKQDARLGFSDSTPQDVIDPLWELTSGIEPGVTLKDWYADDSFDFMSRIKNITVPTLAVCGSEDQFTPVKYHEYLRDNLENCRLEVIENAGHWPFVEKPALFDDAVRRFLESTA